MLDQCVSRIIEYTEANPVLGQAHHFLFNLPLPECDLDAVQFVVMGINPGEAPDDWLLINEPMQQETHLADFHEQYGNGRAAVPWTDWVLRMCGTNNVVQSEAFFWSSRSTRPEHFLDRFGFSMTDNACRPHLKFCRDMNAKLFESHKPSAVIVPGLGLYDLLEPIYDLSRHDTRSCPHTGHRLVVAATDSCGIPWLFTKHWTGARGFTDSQRALIQDSIAAVSI